MTLGLGLRCDVSRSQEFQILFVYFSGVRFWGLRPSTLKLSETQTRLQVSCSGVHKCLTLAVNPGGT